MTKRTQPASTLPLPTVVDPTGRRCFTIQVPDEPQHIAAFMGTLGRLGTWYAWQADDAHTGKDVAAVWRTVIDNIAECPMINIRLKPTDFCVIQLSTDGGTTWADVADLSSCAHAAAVDEIGQAIDRGDLSGGGQQPGQGSGTPGQCYDYTVTLRGNDRWISPVAVEDGDIITTDHIEGAWWDGSPVVWQCADGGTYFLGDCTGGGQYTQGTDPAPTVFHMRLIGNLPADLTTPYFDMYNTPYTVPSGVVLGELYLQANDNALADNQGSINLHVQICKGVWCREFDFTVSDQGFTSQFGGYGTYVSGQGWRTTDWAGQNTDAVWAAKTIGSTVKYFAYEMEYEVDADNGGGSVVAVLEHTAGDYPCGIQTQWPGAGTHITRVNCPVTDADGVIGVYMVHTPNGVQGTTKKIRFYGTGTPPSWGTAC